jgi:hypothetical protein
MKSADIFEFYRRLAEANPDPQTELEFGNTYQLLVAVTLSAQATDVGVNKATRALFEIVKTPQDMLDLGEDGLKDHIKTIGLFNSKAKNVMAMAEILVREHGAKCRPTATNWSNCPAWGARRPMWCSTAPLGPRPLRSTPISSAWATAPALPKARTWMRSSAAWKRKRPSRSAWGRITG